MLIGCSSASGRLPLAPGFDRHGLRHERRLRPRRHHERAGAGVHRAACCDAPPIVERLRREIPASTGALRDLRFPTRLSDTLTLSTFHGCPPGEIERIVESPAARASACTDGQAEPDAARADATRARCCTTCWATTNRACPTAPSSATPTWDADDRRSSDRLGEHGRDARPRLRRQVHQHAGRREPPRRSSRPSEKEMYLSGPPLHVLAMHLVRPLPRARSATGYPISFSAGIDRGNFADAVALGLVPVTACTDLLKPGGYAPRARLLQACASGCAAGRATIDEFVVTAYGQAERRSTLACRASDRRGCRPRCRRRRSPRDAVERSRAGYRRRGSEHRDYVERVAADPRYAAAANSKPPRKIGRRLQLFDCITCDKCVPVCPNDANFTFVLPRDEIPVVKVAAERARRGGARGRAPARSPRSTRSATSPTSATTAATATCSARRTAARTCSSRASSGRRRRGGADRPRDGFFLERRRRREHRCSGRFGGREYRSRSDAAACAFSGDGFAVALRRRRPRPARIEGDARDRRRVDLTYFRHHELAPARRCLAGRPNYVNCVRTPRLRTHPCMTSHRRRSPSVARARRPLHARHRPLPARHDRDPVRERRGARGRSSASRAEMERARLRRSQDRRARQRPRPGRQRPAPSSRSTAHLDTVGVGDPSTWTRDPYKGELRDGIVYGRGAGDQEAGIAAAVYGAPHHQGARTARRRASSGSPAR